MGRFDNLATQPARGFGDVLSWRVLDTLRRKRRRDPAGYSFTTPVRANDGSQVAAAAASLTWIGHATFVLRLGGVLVATDPVWSEHIFGGIGASRRAGVALERLLPIEVVTVSHNHYDHLDLPSLKRIGKKTVYVTLPGNGSILRRAGLDDIVELDWWQSHRIGALEITAVPARHWSMRAPWNRNDMLWGGFVYRGPEGVAYHSGDTALFDGFTEISRRLGPIDWAMLPIGAYEPRWSTGAAAHEPRRRRRRSLSADSALAACRHALGHAQAHRRASRRATRAPARAVGRTEARSEADVDFGHWRDEGAREG